MYRPNVFGEDNSKNKVFHVPIGETNNIKMRTCDPHVPEIKYVQDDENTCCLGSLASDFFSSNKHVAEHAVMSLLS